MADVARDHERGVSCTSSHVRCVWLEAAWTTAWVGPSANASGPPESPACRSRLYTQVFSPQLGTIAFTAFVPDLASLEEANDKLMVESDFLAALRDGAEFVETPVDDLLFDVVHGGPGPCHATSGT